MAHFVKIDENNNVIDITVISNCAIGSCIGPEHWDYQEEYHKEHGSLDFPNTEPLGQKLLNELGFEGHWLQTSYNANFRGRYAGIGMLYDPEQDIFYTPSIEEELTE
jgi:hypothetical protein